MTITKTKPQGSTKDSGGSKTTTLPGIPIMLRDVGRRLGAKQSVVLLQWQTAAAECTGAPARAREPRGASRDPRKQIGNMACILPKPRSNGNYCASCSRKVAICFSDSELRCEQAR